MTKVTSIRHSEAGELSLRLHPDALWTVDRCASPIVGTAIHNGHQLRREIGEALVLDEADRLREEDPFTEYVIRDAPNRVIFHRSRFEIDLNRGEDGAVYTRPEQSWGLRVWNRTPDEALVARSLAIHHAYYSMLREMLSGLVAEQGGFVLLDIHSYNHRRAGPDTEPSPESAAPQINIGTFSMDRERWAAVVDPFIECLRDFSFRGRTMNVRENVAFQGKGEQTRFVHATFPETGCAIAVEFKKFFMDEWTGAPDLQALQAMRTMISASLPVLLGSIKASA